MGNNLDMNQSRIMFKYGSVVYLDHSLDGKHLVVGQEDRVETYDILTQQEGKRLGNKSGLHFQGIKYSADGLLIASIEINYTRGVGLYTVIKIWNALTQELISEWNDEDHQIENIGFSMDNSKMIIGSYKGIVKIRDSKNSFILGKHDLAVYYVNYSPCISAGMDKIRDIETRSKLRSLSCHTPCFDLYHLNNGKLLNFYYRHFIYTLNVQTVKFKQTLAVNLLLSISPSPDQKFWLHISGQKKITLQERKSGRIVRFKRLSHQYDLQLAFFSNNGKSIVIVGDRYLIFVPFDNYQF